jgi:hypothetical protein
LAFLSRQQVAPSDSNLLRWICWRRLAPGELDHERVWLAVSVSAFFILAALIYSGVPLPKCLWHEMTGIPCPGCGGTRCARAIMAGSPGTAFALNPFVFTNFIVVILYDAYAAIVLLFRLPRLRFANVPPWLGHSTRFGVAAIFVLSWTWIILDRR